MFLAVLVAVFVPLGLKMGGSNMLKTIMATAHDLLLNTVFYLMGITVLTGALSKLMSEFGVVSLLERVLRPLMKPLYNLPGVAIRPSSRSRRTGLSPRTSRNTSLSR